MPSDSALNVIGQRSIIYFYCLEFQHQKAQKKTQSGDQLSAADALQQSAETGDVDIDDDEEADEDAVSEINEDLAKRPKLDEMLTVRAESEDEEETQLTIDAD